MNLIYLDNAATAPPDPAILAEMVARATAQFGNPNSLHPIGRRAADALAQARARLAAQLGGAPDEVVLTGGGTEANGLAILGSAGVRPARVAFSAVEHASVREAAHWLRDRAGWTADEIPVDAEGRVTPEGLAATLRPDTRIVAIMLANNEVGAINDLPTLARVVREAAPHARLVVDAVQAFAKVPFRVGELGADCVAVTSHKIHGPHGIGALWTRTPLRPVFRGGGQEGGRRGGTQCGALAWAFAEAAERQAAAMPRLTSLGDRLWSRLTDALPQIRLTGPPRGPQRLPHQVHVLIPGLPGEPLFKALAAAGVCVSAGSACSKGRFSPVLRALGRRAEDGAYLRLSVGRFTTESEIDEGVARLFDAVDTLAALQGATPSRRILPETS